ncbi:MAG: hypothetical protein ACI8WB_002002 [Phenylobacterium sp.]|jgi:hypothetical protein
MSLVHSVDTMALLLAVDATQHTTASVSNFYYNIVGGGGLFEWDSSGDKFKHNGGTIIDPTHTVPPGSSGWLGPQHSTTDGVWRRINTANYIDVNIFGAKANGIYNCSDVIYFITLFFNGADGNIYFPLGQYLLDTNSTTNPAETLIGSNITVIMGHNATFKLGDNYSLKTQGTMTTEGTFPINQDSSFSEQSLNARTNRANYAPAMDIAAKTSIELLGSDGPTPTENGVMFSALNNLGERKVFAGIITEAETKTSGGEEGRLHFLVNDGNYSQYVGTVNHDGAWVLGPGLPSLTADIAGTMNTGNTAPLLGERVSVADPDYYDCRGLAVRNLRLLDNNYEDISSLSGSQYDSLTVEEKEALKKEQLMDDFKDLRSGMGFTIRNFDHQEVTSGLIRTRFSDATANAHHTYMYASTFVNGLEVNGPYFYNKQLFDNGRFIGPDKDTVYTGEISGVKTLVGAGNVDLVTVTLDDDYGACIIEINATGRGTGTKAFALSYKRHISIMNAGTGADVRVMGSDHIYSSGGASTLVFTYVSGNTFKVSFVDDFASQNKHISFNAKVMGGCGNNGTDAGIASLVIAP